MNKELKIFGVLLLLLFSGCTYFKDLNLIKQACDKLSNVDDAKKALEEHKDVVSKLEKLSPTGSIWFDLDSETCPGNGSIVIAYGNLEQRDKIKDAIGDNFFGIPYRMINV